VERGGIVWYYSFQNQQVGPVEDDAISGLVADQRCNTGLGVIEMLIRRLSLALADRRGN